MSVLVTARGRVRLEAGGIPSADGNCFRSAGALAFHAWFCLPRGMICLFVCPFFMPGMGLERIAFDQIRTFTLYPEAAIALANAFGVQGEFE